MTHRHAASATIDLLHAVTKLVFVLWADSNLTAPAFESEAKKLDAFGTADAALLVVDHQLQFASQVVLDRTGHADGDIRGFGEYEESSSSGNFTPRPSRNRTGTSRLIRLLSFSRRTDSLSP